MGKENFKVLIAIDGGLASRLALVLSDKAQVIEAGPTPNLDTLYLEHRPNIVAIETSADAGFALDRIDRLRQIDATVKIVAFSSSPDVNVAIQAIRAGVSGYLTTSAPDNEIALAFDRVMTGENHVEHGVALSIIGHQVETSKRLSLLSPRELDVLKQLGSGKRIKEISADLGIEPKAGSAICSSLRHKLKLESLSALVDFARSSVWPILAR